MIFVTVGSTRFDALIRELDSEACQQSLRNKGFHSLLVQYGNSDTQPQSRVPGLRVECYQFKPTLLPDFSRADLVITHAGYGCLMEALQLRKAVVAVINTTLMDNHQLEIAAELERGNYLVKCYPQTLAKTITDTDLTAFVPLPRACPEKYLEVIENL